MSCKLNCDLEELIVRIPNKENKQGKFMKKIKILIAILLIAISFTGCRLELPTDEFVGGKGLLSVVFIDTGNSDSIFIDFPDGRKMLIDAADVNDKNKIFDVLREYKTEKINYAINTHPHSDHIGSYPEILKTYDFDKFYMPKVEFDNDFLNETAQVINSKNKLFTRGKAGMVLSNDDVYAEILSPMYDHYGEENDYSIVLYLKYGEVSFLFTGDAENKIENDLLNKNKVPEVDVLKVGHHGSKGSSSKNFLNAAKPRYAVITTGKNSYGHPDKKVTSMLNAMGIKTYRTDLSGNITFTTDGKTLNPPETER